MINNRNLEDENWKFIEITKINDKIIKDLVKNLNKDLSDDFYISIDSLLRIGKKAKPELKASLDELNGVYKFKRKIYNVLLNYIENPDNKCSILTQLYHPDFTIRAKTIMLIAENKDLSYLHYLLPLIDDPDDSVRWTLINSLINLDQVKNPIVFRNFEKHFERELNPVIKKKLQNILSKN